MEDFEKAAGFCEKMQKEVGAAIATIKQRLLTELRAAKSPAALLNALRNLSARNGDVITLSMTVDNKPVYTMKEVAGHILLEMLTNYNSLTSIIIDALNREAVNDAPIPPTLITQVVAKVESYALWGQKVGPRTRPWGVTVLGEWDHKPDITDSYRHFSYDSKTKKLYMYDIWSNIHYGFVGAAIHFTTWELTTGAKVANVLSSRGASLIKYGQADDPRDQAAIMLGIDLWSKYGANLNLDALVSAVQDNAASLSTFDCDCLANLSP